ncbi:unnamed protein product [Ambrosiozyma monospora]|uniref:Unnamed protein product n=1 Tax=Ambrosiozyma monospora TaxID=43982 RepID=A0ACB5U6B4_AMBMO|nr:unnamed protein product [Ambrosiozyma monospora]
MSTLSTLITFKDYDEYEPETEQLIKSWSHYLKMVVHNRIQMKLEIDHNLNMPGAGNAFMNNSSFPSSQSAAGQRDSTESSIYKRQSYESSKRESKRESIFDSILSDYTEDSMSMYSSDSEMDDMMSPLPEKDSRVSFSSSSGASSTASSLTSDASSAADSFKGRTPSKGRVRKINFADLVPEGQTSSSSDQSIATPPTNSVDKFAGPTADLPDTPVSVHDDAPSLTEIDNVIQTSGAYHESKFVSSPQADVESEAESNDGVSGDEAKGVPSS